MKWDKDVKFKKKSRNNQYLKEKSHKVSTPKFPFLKSWKTWLYGTLKSISENFDDLWTCMNLGGLKYKECS